MESSSQRRVYTALPLLHQAALSSTVTTHTGAEQPFSRREETPRQSVHKSNSFFNFQEQGQSPHPSLHPSLRHYRHSISALQDFKHQIGFLTAKNWRTHQRRRCQGIVKQKAMFKYYINMKVMLSLFLWEQRNTMTKHPPFRSCAESAAAEMSLKAKRGS